MMPGFFIQQNQQLSGTSFATYRDFHQLLAARGPTATTPNGGEMRAEPFNGLPWPNAVQQQQPAWYPSSNDQATPAAMPMMPTQAIQFPHQQPSYLDPQLHSPTTVQGGGVPHPVSPDSIMYPNLAISSMHENGAHLMLNLPVPPMQENGAHLMPNLPIRPMQENGAHLMPQFAPVSSYHPVLINSNGQLPPGITMSTFTQSPGPSHEHIVESVQLMRAHQESLARPGHQPPEPVHHHPEYDPNVQGSADYDAFTNAAQGCQCDSDCNCLFCARHPLNPATTERVQQIQQIIAEDFEWPENPHENPYLNLPQNGSGVAHTNGNPVFPNPIEWSNAHTQDPPLQPIYGGGESVHNTGQSNGLIPQAMLNDDFYTTVAYPMVNLGGNCTNTTGTCQCFRSCPCPGCLSHQGCLNYQGHIELPN